MHFYNILEITSYRNAGQLVVEEELGVGRSRCCYVSAAQRCSVVTDFISVNGPAVMLHYSSAWQYLWRDTGQRKNRTLLYSFLRLYVNLWYLKMKSLIKAPVIYRIHREISLESKTYPKPHPSIALVNTTFPWSGEKYRWESSVSSKPVLQSYTCSPCSEFGFTWDSASLSALSSSTLEVKRVPVSALI